MNTEAFDPRWASPPGDTIRDVMALRGIDLRELSNALELPPARVTRLLDGSEPISIELARRLTTTIGGSVEFWLARDGQYREDLDTVAADNWATSLPIGDMAAFGWISPPLTWRERVTTALEFFGVANYRSWEARYGPIAQSVRFRFSPASNPDANAVMAWLRRAQVIGEQSDLEPWNRTAFADVLPKARELTTQRDPAHFLPLLVSLCASAGVSLTVVRAPRHCAASGAARFLDEHRAQIVLSARYLSDDHLWFTFFHEAAHLLLHDPSTTFIDEFEQVLSPSDSREERQADDFAGNVLVPPEVRERLPRHQPKPRELLVAARAAAVSPGIIVGQLQHSGVLGFGTRFNGFKRRYRWNGPTLERA